VFGVAASLTYVVALAISGSATVATIASLLPTLAYPVSYSFPKLIAPALACAMAWAYVARPSSMRLALLGLAVAVSFLLRHDLGLLAEPVWRRCS
jgi:hypothetical protein